MNKPSFWNEASAYAQIFLPRYVWGYRGYILRIEVAFEYCFREFSFRHDDL